MLVFFKCTNDEPYYLGGQVMPGTISRVFYVLWRTILRRRGSSLKAGCTRYSPQQMADFECWNKWPGLSSSSSSSSGLTSSCRVPLLCHRAQLWQKMSLNGSHSFIPRTKPFLKEHHLFWDSTTSLESARLACHKTSTTEQCSNL